MLIPTHTEKALSIFANKVIKESKKNLSSKDTTKKLSNSLGFEMDVHKQSFYLGFEMEDYGDYQDKGVSGKEKIYNTEFKYTNKRPPTSAFDKWIIKKGKAPRDKDGKFLSRLSQKFALANYIYKNGIKPSLFFTNPFNKAFVKLPNDVVEAFALDTENFLKYTLDNDTK